MKITNIPCCELPKLTSHIIKGGDGVYEVICRKCKKRGSMSVDDSLIEEIGKDDSGLDDSLITGRSS